MIDEIIKMQVSFYLYILYPTSLQMRICSNDVTHCSNVSNSLSIFVQPKDIRSKNKDEHCDVIAGAACIALPPPPGGVLTHSFLTTKQLFPGFVFTFFYAIFKLLRPEHDCYAKFTSCSTSRNIKTTL